jgi:hypothetical protein
MTSQDGSALGSSFLELAAYEASFRLRIFLTPRCCNVARVLVDIHRLSNCNGIGGEVYIVIW